MRKVLVLLFMVCFGIYAHGQVSQLKPESKYLKLLVYSGDELIACDESEYLENILKAIFDKYEAEQTIQWSYLLADHKCAFVQYNSIITIIGLKPGGEQLEEYEAYEYELDDNSYVFVKAHIERDEDLPGEGVITPSGNYHVITASGDAWIVGDFVYDVARAIK